MLPDFDIFKTPKYELEGIVVHARKRLNMKGEIAQRLMEHLAIAAGQEDGEDSAGRRAFKLQTPEQVVTRACEIADKLVNEFEARGWVVEIPAYQDVPLAEKANIART